MWKLTGYFTEFSSSMQSPGELELYFDLSKQTAITMKWRQKGNRTDIVNKGCFKVASLSHCYEIKREIYFENLKNRTAVSTVYIEYVTAGKLRTTIHTGNRFFFPQPILEMEMEGKLSITLSVLLF